MKIQSKWLYLAVLLFLIPIPSIVVWLMGNDSVKTVHVDTVKTLSTRVQLMETSIKSLLDQQRIELSAFQERLEQESNTETRNSLISEMDNLKRLHQKRYESEIRSSSEKFTKMFEEAYGQLTYSVVVVVPYKSEHQSQDVSQELANLIDGIQ